MDSNIGHVHHISVSSPVWCQDVQVSWMAGVPPLTVEMYAQTSQSGDQLTPIANMSYITVGTANNSVDARLGGPATTVPIRVLVRPGTTIQAKISDALGRSELSTPVTVRLDPDNDDAGRPPQSPNALNLANPSARAAADAYCRSPAPAPAMNASHETSRPSAKILLTQLHDLQAAYTLQRTILVVLAVAVSILLPALLGLLVFLCVHRSTRWAIRAWGPSVGECADGIRLCEHQDQAERAALKRHHSSSTATCVSPRPRHHTTCVSCAMPDGNVVRRPTLSTHHSTNLQQSHSCRCGSDGLNDDLARVSPSTCQDGQKSQILTDTDIDEQADEQVPTLHPSKGSRRAYAPHAVWEEVRTSVDLADREACESRVLLAHLEAKYTADTNELTGGKEERDLRVAIDRTSRGTDARSGNRESKERGELESIASDEFYHGRKRNRTRKTTQCSKEI